MEKISSWLDLQQLTQVNLEALNVSIESSVDVNADGNAPFTTTEDPAPSV